MPRGPGAVGVFKPRDQEQVNEARGGIAMLSLGQLLPDAPQAPRGWLDGLHRARTSIELWCHRHDLAPDLAEDIGSARWFRGLGTLIGLTGLALAFWPDFTAVEAATPMPVKGSARDEYRSQMILPLALGADSGRHMGATALVTPLETAPERPMVQLVATLGQGDSFARMLQRAGVGAGDAATVSAMVARALPLGQIAPGTRFALTLGRRDESGGPRPLDRLEFRARFDLAVAIDRQDGALAIKAMPIRVDETPLRIRGTVGQSLYRSARAAGAPVKAIALYLQQIDAHLGLSTDIAPTDTFDLVVAYRRSASGEVQVGELLYAGLERSGKPRAQLLRWGKGGQFFEASGMGRQSAGMVAPVNGRITSHYGMRRHPILGYARMHGGVDYGAPHGAPIFAVSDAMVTFAGRHGGNGNFVKLDHGGGMATSYSHMSRIAVSPGTRVRTGQVIGYVGSTGLSTGPHLHYEVYQNGRRVNPLSVRFTVRAAVDKAELDAFKARLAQMKAVQPGAALQSIAPKQVASETPEREIDRLGV